jgi:hypothetical protein
MGFGGSSGSATYASTGGQPPFIGDWSSTNAQVCGGATFYPGFGIGAASFGLDVNVCSGSNTFGGGDNTQFRIQRHGPGDVDLRASSGATVDLFFRTSVFASFPGLTAGVDESKSRVPKPAIVGGFPGVGSSAASILPGIVLAVGVGPTFRQQSLTLTSDQSFFGGGVPSIGQTTWQTGFGLSAGVSTFVCPDCIAGKPLKVGVEGRARFFPSQSISLRSPAFGFVETGSTGSTTDYSVQATFSVPVVISDIRVKRDVVPLVGLDNGIGLYRYRYLWSDTEYVGVMAQEVALVQPDAVVRGTDGYLRVDYARLGLRLMTWDEWAAARSDGLQAAY